MLKKENEGEKGDVAEHGHDAQQHNSAPTGLKIHDLLFLMSSLLVPFVVIMDSHILVVAVPPVDVLRVFPQKQPRGAGAAVPGDKQDNDAVDGEDGADWQKLGREDLENEKC